jgi:hypothetical protein
VASFRKCGDEPSGRGATELVSYEFVKVADKLVILQNCSKYKIHPHLPILTL